jgi:hypothetical protein
MEMITSLPERRTLHCIGTVETPKVRGGPPRCWKQSLIVLADFQTIG